MGKNCGCTNAWCHIESASWGANGKFRDITHLVWDMQKYKSDGEKKWYEASTHYWGDPAPGERKTLRINYLWKRSYTNGAETAYRNTIYADEGNSC